MKEATGEVSMTVVTLVAIAVVGGILAFMWPQIKNSISGLWGGVNSEQQCAQSGGTWDPATGRCNFTN